MLLQFNALLYRAVHVISGSAIVMMVLIGFADAVGRMFNHPILGTDEYVEILMLIFFFAGTAVVVRDQAYIRVGFLCETFSRPLQRLEVRATAILETLALCFFCWMILDQADRLARFETQTVYLHIPLAPFAYVAAAMGIVSVWFALQNTLRSLRDPTARVVDAFKVD
jgi:TRAP-type C4-dicarboxylate transport system permease small subunit